MARAGTPARASRALPDLDEAIRIPRPGSVATFRRDDAIPAFRGDLLAGLRGRGAGNQQARRAAAAAPREDAGPPARAALPIPLRTHVLRLRHGLEADAQGRARGRHPRVSGRVRRLGQHRALPEARADIQERVARALRVLVPAAGRGDGAATRARAHDLPQCLERMGRRDLSRARCPLRISVSRGGPGCSFQCRERRRPRRARQASRTSKCCRSANRATCASLAREWYRRISSGIAGAGVNWHCVCGRRDPTRRARASGRAPRTWSAGGAPVAGRIRARC